MVFLLSLGTPLSPPFPWWRGWLVRGPIPALTPVSSKEEPLQTVAK